MQIAVAKHEIFLLRESTLQNWTKIVYFIFINILLWDKYFENNIGLVF